MGPYSDTVHKRYILIERTILGAHGFDFRRRARALPKAV